MNIQNLSITKEIKDEYLKLYDHLSKNSPDRCLYMYGRNSFGLRIEERLYEVDGLQVKITLMK